MGMLEDSLCSLETQGLSQSRNHHGTQRRKIIQKRTLHSGPQAHIYSSLNFIVLRVGDGPLKQKEIPSSTSWWSCWHVDLSWTWRHTAWIHRLFPVQTGTAGLHSPGVAYSYKTFGSLRLFCVLSHSLTDITRMVTRTWIRTVGGHQCSPNQHALYSS